MSLSIEKEIDAVFPFDYEELANRVVSFVMEHEDFPYDAEVNLTLTDNDGIHEINRMYREIDRPTDVLSFPMLSYETAGDFSKLEEDYDDNFNPDTYLWILQECDVPYVPEEWNKLMAKYAMDRSKVTGMTILGRYLSKMKLK